MRIKAGEKLPIFIQMKRLTPFLLVMLALAPAAAASDDDRAQRALEKVSVHVAPGYAAVVKEGFESTLYYKVCVERKAKPNQRSCRRGETNERGVGRVSFAHFVASHGAGRYVARWTGGGLDLGTKRFKAR